MDTQPVHISETIPATLEAVSGLIQSLERQLADVPLASRISITLSLQELCVNIVEHAYDGTGGQIHIKISQRGQELAITITDSAPRAFVPPANIAAPDLNDLPEGGIGLFIIYQSFDKVTYERLEIGNCWHLTKILT